jgi:CRISPR-associated protein Csm1
MPRGATHGQFGRTFLSQLGYSEAVCEAALRHHGRGRSGQTVAEAAYPTTLITYVADNLASASRRGDSEALGFDPAAPLNSILSFVRLGDQSASTERWAYPLAEYGGEEMESYLPGPASLVEADPGAYRKLKDGIVRGFEALADPQDVNSVMALLEGYGSYVRSSTAKADTGDISLFDHSRVTAAIAVCIAGHLNETGTEPTLPEIDRRDVERYLFVRGDISGVQSFLYTITSRGALRMLRARSAFLEVLAEHAVAEVLREAGVPRTNVIYVGGGGFQLLLPNTEEAVEAVRRVTEEINSALADEFGYDLYLALAAAPCNAKGVGEDLPETLRKVGQSLSEAKARRFYDRLEVLFTEPREPELEACDVCTRDDVPVGRYHPKGYEPWRGGDEEPLSLCPTCHMLARASLRLPRSDCNYLRPSGEGFRIGATVFGISASGEGAAYALDGVRDDACLGGAVPLPMGRYAVRDEEGQLLEFGRLADRSVGISRLAVLRADVDDLGEIFRVGLPPDMRTFDRYAALSRAFTTFFKMVVPKVCEGTYGKTLRLSSKEGSRDVTVVYSGGDDLFIVGAWSDVLELAVDVRRVFRQFACENPSVTLSAGVTLHKAGEPLYLMAEQAGAAEEAAKNNQLDEKSKDSVVLFYAGSESRRVSHAVPEALLWEEVEGEVVPLLRRFNSFRSPDGELPFPRGFTHLLMEVVNTYESDGYLSLPRLAYALARMEDGELKKDRRWQELKRELLRIEVVRRHLRPAAYWLDLAERRKEAR